MRVKACVLTYREVEMAARCLESLATVSDREIFFNGSDYVAESGFFVQGVEAISSGENLPFAEVVNRAIERANGYDLLLFATNDITFHAGAVAKLIECMAADPEIGLAGPRQRTGDDSAWHHCGGDFRFDKWSAEVLTSPEEAGEADERVWLDGGALLIRLDAARKVGGMRPEYGFYWEDVDWGLRFNQAGFKVVVCPESVAMHEKSPTIGRFGRWKKYMIARNRALSARLNLEGEEFERLAKYLKRSALVKLVKKGFGGDGRLLWAAVRDGLAGRYEKTNVPIGDDDPIWNELLRF